MPKAKRGETTRARPRRTRVRVAVLALVVAAVGVGIPLWLHHLNAPKDGVALTPFPPPPTPPPDSVHFEDFVGSERCAGCHAAQFTAWSKSTHGRAGQAPARDLVLRRFDGALIRFRDASVEPRMNGGQYEFVVNWVGRTDRYPIAGVVGGGHMMGGGTQGFLWRHPDGSLRLLPFEIASTDSAWFCNTITRANHGWARITSSMSIADCGDWPPPRVMGSSARFASCQECHGSQIEMRNAERPNDTRLVSLAINCESCHGPGRKHAERGATVADANIGMKPLATLSRDASVGLCMSCHALKIDVRRGYLPGRALEDRYSLKLALLGGDEVHPDGRTRSFAYQQGHLYSDCYLSGSMTCVDCHEPHSQQYRDINGRALNGRFDDAQCTDCHASKAERPELHTRHQADSPGSRCVACHMPYIQESAVGSEIKYGRSDHTISIPRPELDQRLGVVNACLTCHRDRNADQLSQDTRRLWGELKPLRPIIDALVKGETPEDFERILLDADTTHRYAYVDALSRYFSALTPNGRTIPRRVQTMLWRLAASRDDDLAALALATLHLDGGNAARMRGRLTDRIRALGQRDLNVRRRWAIALGHRADALRESLRPVDAITVYEKALELLPDDVDFLMALGVTRLDAGDAQGASQALQRAVTADSRNSLALINYGRARFAAGDVIGAQEAYRRATEVNPYDPLAYFNLGNAFMRNGQRAEAVRAYRRASELDFSLAPAHFNLARVLLLENRDAEALTALRTGLVFDPENREARDVVVQLETALGETRKFN